MNIAFVRSTDKIVANLTSSSLSFLVVAVTALTMSQTLPTSFETVGPDWAATYNAYGPATDIPRLLHLLESNDCLIARMPCGSLR